MKNKTKLLWIIDNAVIFSGIITAVAIIVLVLTGCGDSKPCEPGKEGGKHEWETKGKKNYLYSAAQHWIRCSRCKIEKSGSREEHKGSPCKECGYVKPKPAPKYSGGGPNCFAAGTQILMADNTLKTIESVKAGDTVQSYDFESGGLIVSTVTKFVAVQHYNLWKLKSAAGNEIVVTADHPFWVAKGCWAAVDAEKANELYYQKTAVAELNTGDKVFMPQNNTFIEIVDMELIPAMQMTYTIELSQNDNFIANGMLVKTEDVK
ncbi:MAG: Hint domain-containing protein [Leptospirales bacterium]|nr:Hint domain-containing protein [Leptospirales bacterium]